MVSEKLFLSIIRPKTLSWSKKRSKFCFEKKNREISIKDVLQEEKKTTGIRKLLTNNFRPSKTIEGEVVNKMLTLVVIKKEGIGQRRERMKFQGDEAIERRKYGTCRFCTPISTQKLEIQPAASS
uniref:Uncharacterized protein n=1 Tax=Rhizophagus irregularis (strain DAOM 181602 / DAOM 197198 / MUCL 43194) TaxID=747089 RepID=U9T885_RHIID